MNGGKPEDEDFVKAQLALACEGLGSEKRRGTAWRFMVLSKPIITVLIPQL